MSPKRIEKDYLGEAELSNLVYYGINTFRLLQTNKISDILEPIELILALVQVKKACVMANIELELILVEKGNAILKACDEILAGANISQFVTDIFHGGRGSQLNINANEIIANRALEILNHKLGEYNIISPFDDVNMSQADADVFNTASKIAILFSTQKLLNALNELKSTFLTKSLKYDYLLKPAKVNFSNSFPISLGQEFLSYAEIIKKCIDSLEDSKKKLYYLEISGGEVGTGANIHPKFGECVIQKLREITKIEELKLSENFIESLAFGYDILDFASKLKNLAISLLKISSDILKMTEEDFENESAIRLPILLNNSSMIPMQNSSHTLENLSMVSMQVIGIEQTINQAFINTVSNLNVNMPLVTFNLLFAIKILTNAINIVIEKTLNKLTVNENYLQKNYENNISLIALLVPRLGYQKVTELILEAKKENKNIINFLVEKNILSKDEAEKLIQAQKIIKPGFKL